MTEKRLNNRPKKMEYRKREKRRGTMLWRKNLPFMIAIYNTLIKYCNFVTVYYDQKLVY